MKNIDEFNKYFIDSGIEKQDLMECSLRIHAYMESITKSYNIDIDNEHHEQISEKVYKTLLNHIYETAQEDENIEQEGTKRNSKYVFKSVLKDLREGGEAGTGTIMFLIGKSGINEETRHNTLTLIASLISRELDKSDIDLNKEIDDDIDDIV
jgi:hypothetical protein